MLNLENASSLPIQETMRDDMPNKKLSKAKKIILDMLWPMEWVEGEDIFKTAQQTDYDWDIRELRESGWPIKTVGTKYKLVSHEKTVGNKHRYPTVAQKQRVFERDLGICQICGAMDAYMQFDQKVPQERLGEIEVGSLQLLCRICKVKKRGACQSCRLATCDHCPYAYPKNSMSTLL